MTEGKEYTLLPSIHGNEFYRVKDDDGKPGDWFVRRFELTEVDPPPIELALVPEKHLATGEEYADALTKNGVAMEMHLFPTGGHGFGLGQDEDGTAQWIGLAANWIKRLK